MMFKKKVISLLLNGGFFLLWPGLAPSCAFLSPREESEKNDPAEARLQEAEDLLDNENFSLASEKFSLFEKAFPYSVFLYRAKLGHGQALAGQKLYTEALALYKEVIEADLSSLKRPLASPLKGKAPSHQQESEVDESKSFIGLASYYASFCYEALGDEEKAYFSLRDAQSNRAYLPKEISQSELPARMAAYYNRQGDLEMAKFYYQQAEIGTAIVFREPSPTHRKLKAKMFYMMGQLPRYDMSAKTVDIYLKNLSLMQKFLLRSIEANETPWSSSALKNIQENYQTVWDFVQTIPLENKNLDLVAAEKERQIFQNRVVNHIFQLIQEIHSYRAPSDGKDNLFEKNLFSFLAKLESQGEDFLRSQNTFPLTPEAQKRQNLRREGTIRDRKNDPNVPSQTQGEKSND